jgi:hypothetical protein
MRRAVLLAYPTRFERRHAVTILEAQERELQARWLRVVKAAAPAALGKEWFCTDYRVSGIGRDEFPQEVKDTLRHINREISDLAHLMWVLQNTRSARGDTSK